jgi:hypothetical protein
MVWIGIGIVLTTALLLKRRALRLSSLGGVGLLVAIVVPSGMYLGLRFSTYYSWVAWRFRSPSSTTAYGRRRTCAVEKVDARIASCGLFVGLPADHRGFAADWKERDAQPSAQFVGSGSPPR